MTGQVLNSLLSELGLDPSRARCLAEKEKWRFLDRWRSAFIPEFRQHTDKWPSGEAPWDVLGSPHVKCSSGPRADEAFQASDSGIEFVAVSDHTGSSTVHLVRCEERITASRMRAAVLNASAFINVCLTDEEYSWSYVLDHEDQSFFVRSKQQPSPVA